jgi:hypothetical protein
MDVSATKKMTKYQFIGWIPCVTGHLDFSLMSVGLHGTFMPDHTGFWQSVFNRPEEDKKRDRVNYTFDGLRGGHTRRITLQSWVDWRDHGTGDGKARVIVSAEAAKSDNLDERSLSGRMLIYPRAYKNDHQVEHNSIMSLVRTHADLQTTYWSKDGYRRSMSWPDTQ